jgi:hypothetical protein
MFSLDDVRHPDCFVGDAQDDARAFVFRSRSRPYEMRVSADLELGRLGIKTKRASPGIELKLAEHILMHPRTSSWSDAEHSGLTIIYTEASEEGPCFLSTTAISSFGTKHGSMPNLRITPSCVLY